MAGMGICTGEEYRPIQLRLEAEKSEYVFGEKIVIYITIANASDSTQNIVLSGDVGQGNIDLLKLLDNDEPPIRLKGRTYLSAGVFILEAQQSIRLRYSWVFLRPGTHNLSVVYSYKPEYAHVADVDNLWRGSSKSDEITIVVNDIPLAPEAQGEFDKYQEHLISLIKDYDMETKRRIIHVMMQYLPLSRKVLSFLLQDEDANVRFSVVWGVAFHANKQHCIDARLTHDVSMLADVIAMADAETDQSVKIWISMALGAAYSDLDEGLQKRAMAILKKYLYDPSGLLAGQAACNLIRANPRQGAIYIREMLSKTKTMDFEFRNLLFQAIYKTTGKTDIREGLEQLIKMGD